MDRITNLFLKYSNINNTSDVLNNIVDNAIEANIKITASREEFVKNQFIERFKKENPNGRPEEAEHVYNQILSKLTLISKKYLGWIVNQYFTNPQELIKSLDRDTDGMTLDEYLMTFTRVKENPRRLGNTDFNPDINGYDIAGLKNVVNQYLQSEMTEREKDKKFRREREGHATEGVKELFATSDGEWTVYQPLTLEGNRAIAPGAFWCTTKTQGNFDNYCNAPGNLITIINNNDITKSMELSKGSGEFNDYYNKPMSRFTALVENDELAKFLKPYMNSEQKQKLQKNIEYGRKSDDEKWSVIKSKDEQAIKDLIENVDLSDDMITYIIQNYD